MWLQSRPQRLLVALFGVLALLASACGDDQAAAPEGEGTQAPVEGTEAPDEGTEAPTDGTEAPDDGATAAADFDCSMFEGETITFVVPFSPGGGYDSYARMIAPFLAEETGANVIVENQDGAGGLLAINSLLTAEPDGTTIAIMNAVGAGGGAIAGAEGVQFELDQLSYIGRVGASYHIFSTGADSELETWDDVLAAEDFQYGSTGPGAADFVNGNLLSAIFEQDWQIVTGFEGSEENELAVTRGDVDGMTGDFDSRLPAIESGDHTPLLLIGPEPDPRLPDVPALLELDLDERQMAIAEAQVDLLDFGRPIVGPPDIPEDRLACLRGALAASVQNPELVEQSETIQRPIAYMSGEDLEELVQRLLEPSPEFKEVLEQAYSTG